MRRNVIKNLHLADTDYRQEIEDDLDKLQLAANPVIFNKAKAAFIKKWTQKKEKEFVAYMSEMWFSSHQTWYEGARLRTPSTNNALESFNLVIKKEHTLRERLPLPRFFELCLQAVEK